MTQKKKSKSRSLSRDVNYVLPLKIANWCLRLRFPGLALKIAAHAEAYMRRTPSTAWVRLRALEALGKTDAARKERIFRLRDLVAQNARREDLVAVMKNMAELERLDGVAPLSASRLIVNALNGPKGRRKLLKAALKANERFKESAFLLHIITLCEAMQGDFHKSSARLIEAGSAPFAVSRSIQQRQSKLIDSSWRVVDQVAREQMEWADRDLAQRTKQGENSVVDAPRTLMRERLLQTRNRPDYLALCAEDLAAAETLKGRLAAIQGMLRTSIRHVPDYTESYELARRSLQQHRDELEMLFQPAEQIDPELARALMQDLCTYLVISHRLDDAQTVERITAHLLGLSEFDALLPVMWGCPRFIQRAEGGPEVAARIMARIQKSHEPKINLDVQGFFHWAMNAHRYEEADLFFETLSKKLQQRQGVLYYVNILQRQGRFEEALRLLRDIHVQALANPLRVNAYTNYSLIKRGGELRFLIKTAQIYSQVPQPQSPKGVIFVAPRNIDQLRRIPLMVLRQFKQDGWAVIPLVEGMLPRETTGILALDQLNGVIHANTTISARAALPDLDDFSFAPHKGYLSVAGVDLSHSLWEDAAINRRRHTINWKCPELTHYSGGLANWSRSVGQVLCEAQHLGKLLDLPMGTISLFSYRLPDALPRLYCEKYGDPDRFFCLQAANGYQNYFTNFSTNVSQRLVLRNVTRTPEVRSGSFPIPVNFRHYYRNNRYRLSEIMERFEPITKVRRSTEGLAARSPEALELDARIAQWRARGGKVACAFGKVVCDSGVPYDGGPVHKDMREWINHCVRAVQGSNTLLLIKPHPHELNNQIATFPTEYFRDMIEEPLGEQAIFMGHRWFDMDDMRSRMDFGVVYNGTTTVELGLMGIPAILCGHFGAIDYPIGQVEIASKADFEAMIRAEKPVVAAADVKERAAMWLDYMANENFTQPYRFHVRPVTNKVIYPPFWFQEDLEKHEASVNPAVAELAGRALGTRFEPGDPRGMSTGDTRSSVIKS